MVSLVLKLGQQRGEVANTGRFGPSETSPSFLHYEKRVRAHPEEPSSFTLAQQMRAAETLRVRVVGGGMSHWTCHTMGHRYGSTPGNNLVWVTGEIHSKTPRWCARNLHRNWHRSWKVAKSVCGVT